MTAQQPICDGHQGEVGAGQTYATVVAPGAPDRHLCLRCAHLVWRYLPDLVRHRDLTEHAFRSPSVRERAMSIDLVGALVEKHGKW